MEGGSDSVTHDEAADMQPLPSMSHEPPEPWTQRCVVGTRSGSQAGLVSELPDPQNSKPCSQ